jgi:hypothetical protein
MHGTSVPVEEPSTASEADIDASLLRRLEPFQMVQLVCRGTLLDSFRSIV